MRIRPLAADDLPQVIPHYTDPVIRAYLGGPIAEETAWQRAEELLTEQSTWAIVPTENGPVAGIVTLHPHHDRVSTEISYSLLPDFHGRGYGSFGVRGVMAIAFVERALPLLVSETQKANLRSIRLLERVGMSRRESVLRFGAEQIIYAIDSLTHAGLRERTDRH